MKSVWIPPRRVTQERFVLLPSIEAVITPKNMLPWSIKRMARAELLCTYKRICSFPKQGFPAARWSSDWGQNHLINHILHHAYLLSTWRSLIFSYMIDWSFKKVGTEIYNDCFWKHPLAQLQIVSPMPVSEDYSATEIIIALCFLQLVPAKWFLGFHIV